MVITLSGDDSYALRSAQNNFVQGFIKRQGELALERFDGEESTSEQILDAIQSVPFLSSEKMVLLTSASKQKDFLDGLEDTLNTIPESTTLILVDSKLDKRAKYYKTLQKISEFKEFNSDKAEDISSWIISATKERGGQVDRTAANYLVSQIGTNKTGLANEIDKLVLYDQNVTKQTIDELCEPTPQSTIFQLLDAVFAKNYKRANELYKDQRQQKVEPLAILAMVTWQLYIFAILKTAGERNIDEIAKSSKINPFVLRKSKQLITRLPLSQLRQMIRRALELDVRLKTESINADQALQHLLLTIA